MKRFFLYLIICLFVGFVYLSFSSSSPVQASVCSSCNQGDCCGGACGGSQFCSGNQIYGCFCEVIAPTNAPATCPSCPDPVISTCTDNPPCATGQCFPVCNYDVCEWGCTGDSTYCTQADCTAWSGWVCTSDGVTETRYCTAPTSSPDCTQVSQARQPCSGPTPTGGGGPTDTPGPTIPPGATNTPVPPTNTPTPTAIPTPTPTPLSIPIGSCETFDTSTATTPVTWNWANGTGLQVYDDTGKWWYNTDASSGITISKDQNNIGPIPGIPPGRTVNARTTNDFSTFSSLGSITCDLPDNKQTVISGVLRQKSGTGCYQADASNNFNITNLSGSTGDSCVTIAEPCTFSIDKQHAISYSCTVTWDNQACVAQGRQPDTTQTLTINTTATGFSAGQFSDVGCDPINPTPNEKNLTITAGTNNSSANITFPVTNEKWVKLKNTSFTASSTISNNIPVFVNKFTPSDSDDDGSKYFIMSSLSLPDSSAGVALRTTSNAYSAANWYDSSYPVVSLSMNPSVFLSYVKARKQYTAMTAHIDPNDLSEITSPGIYVHNGPLTLDKTHLDLAPATKFVLIVDGDVTIDQDKFNSNDCISAVKSIAILSKTGKISFSDTTQCAAGIFIANNVDAGTTANQGLKIKGNLIAQSTLTNDRSWSDTSRPGLFIVFDPVQYIDLLPYLSIASYEWRQLQ